MQDMIEGNITPLYESLFSDPITIDILFRFSDTPPGPEGTPVRSRPGVLAASFSTIYTLPWNDFISALRGIHGPQRYMAIASLPARPLSTNIAPSSANGRAVGLNTPHALFADGSFGQGGPYDGIVTLNSVQPFWFSRPLISGSFDAQLAVEHEMDEIMGLGSYLNRNAQTCPSFEAEPPGCPQPPGEECSIVAGGAVIQSCPNCSGGADVGFVGNNSGTLQFNQIFANASGRLNLKIWYANGDAVRYAFLSVNGGPGTSLTFPSTGSFQTVGSIEITLTNLNPGSNNTLKFSNPIVGQWAPDFDRIEMTCNIPPPPVSARRTCLVGRLRTSRILLRTAHVISRSIAAAPTLLISTRLHRAILAIGSASRARNIIRVYRTHSFAPTNFLISPRHRPKGSTSMSLVTTW